MITLKVLAACEQSGIVRDEFLKLGHRAYSCDLEDSIIPSKYHIKGDVSKILNDDWDLIIAFPPCTHLCVSGARYFKEKQEDGRQQQAIDFFMEFVNAKCPKVCIENPVGIMSTKYRKPDQIIQPYNFGENASKATCLWLKGLPLLKNTDYFPPRIINGKKRWANQCDSGQNKLGPSEDRGIKRAITYQKIAQQMAFQWGGIVTNVRFSDITLDKISKGDIVAK